MDFFLLGLRLGGGLVPQGARLAPEQLRRLWQLLGEGQGRQELAEEEGVPRPVVTCVEGFRYVMVEFQWPCCRAVVAEMSE